jgi:DnaJ-class molecular chaperone
MVKSKKVTKQEPQVEEVKAPNYDCFACKGEGLNEKEQRCEVCAGTGKK